MSCSDGSSASTAGSDISVVRADDAADGGSVSDSLLAELFPASAAVDDPDRLRRCLSNMAVEFRSLELVCAYQTVECGQARVEAADWRMKAAAAESRTRELSEAVGYLTHALHQATAASRNGPFLAASTVSMGGTDALLSVLRGEACHELSRQLSSARSEVARLAAASRYQEQSDADSAAASNAKLAAWSREVSRVHTALSNVTALLVSKKRAYEAAAGASLHRATEAEAAAAAANERLGAVSASLGESRQAASHWQAEAQRLEARLALAEEAIGVLHGEVELRDATLARAAAEAAWLAGERDELRDAMAVHAAAPVRVAAAPPPLLLPRGSENGQELDIGPAVPCPRRHSPDPLRWVDGAGDEEEDHRHADDTAADTADDTRTAAALLQKQTDDILSQRARVSALLAQAAAPPTLPRPQRVDADEPFHRSSRSDSEPNYSEPEQGPVAGAAGCACCRTLQQQLVAERAEADARVAAHDGIARAEFTAKLALLLAATSRQGSGKGFGDVHGHATAAAAAVADPLGLHATRSELETAMLQAAGGDDGLGANTSLVSAISVAASSAEESCLLSPPQQEQQQGSDGGAAAAWEWCDLEPGPQ